MSTAAERIAAYHRASKHHPQRYAPGPGGLDWATQPDPFRTFEGAPRVDLPLLADTLATPWSAVRAGAPLAPAPLTLDNLALLLEVALGLSAWKAIGGSRWALRCNPSSGNLHPTEGYLVCAGVTGLADGVHHYRPRDHALECRAASPELAALLAPGTALLGLSSIHWREAWKYGLRAFRYCQHDCGHAIGALAYGAAALGWRARLVAGAADGEIAALLGLDRAGDFDGAEHEAPDCLLALGPDPAAPDPAALAAALAGADWRGRANALSPRRVDWSGIGAAEADARCPGAPAPVWTPPDYPPLPPARLDPPAAHLYRQRRSAVDFDGVTSIPAQVFFTLADALLPRPLAPWSAWPWGPRIHPVFFVHRVEGLEPGLYALPRRPGAVDLLRGGMAGDWDWEPVGPPHLPLHRLTTADARRAAKALSCHQDIAADSCFSLGMLAEFDAALAEGAWCYRRLFWEAGLLGQVLYLEAESAGIRGTGIGCFFDDPVHETLGLAGSAFQSLYHFTAGGPVDDPRLQTEPPYAR